MKLLALHTALACIAQASRDTGIEIPIDTLLLAEKAATISLISKPD